MSAAAAMISGLRVSAPVVVIKHEVLAFKSNNVRDPAKITPVLGYQEGRGRI